MNRRLVKEGMAADDTLERLYKCDACAFYFVIRVIGDTPAARKHGARLEERSLCRSWCPCKPWNISAVEVGMKLPQGWVHMVDRVNNAVEVASELGAPQPWSRLDFSEVSPPQ